MSEREIDRLKLASEVDPMKRIPLLNLLARTYESSELSYAIELLHEALDLCEEVDEPIFFGQTHVNLSRCQLKAAEFEEAFANLSKAEKYFQGLRDQDALIDVQYVRSLVHLEKGELDLAYDLASTVYDQRKQLQEKDRFTDPIRMSADRLGGMRLSKDRSRRNNEYKLGTATRVLAIVEASRMDYTKALYYLDANFELWRRLGEKSELAASLFNTGIVYSRIGDWQSSIKFFLRALAIYRLTGAKNNTIMVLSHLAHSRTQLKNLPVALAELNEAWELVQQGKNAPLEILVSIEYALYHIEVAKFAEAKQWALSALRLATDRRIRSAKGQALTLLGRVLYLSNEYRLAIETLEDGLKLTRAAHQLEEEVGCLKYLYLSHKALDELTIAFSYLEQFQTVESTLLETQQKANAEAIQQRYQTRFVLTSQAVTQAENEELADEVKRLTEELASLIRKMRKKDVVLGKLKKESTTILNQSKEAREILKPILHEVNAGLEDATDRQQFEQRLHDIQRHFVKSLGKRFPSLTKAEARICVLIRSKMSSIEIASLLNISVRTVENHRMHIRQKLHIDESLSMYEALKNI